MKRDKDNIPVEMLQVNAYAIVAARLYGVVTIKEIQEIYNRWEPDSYLNISTIEQFLKELPRINKDQVVYLKGDKVCYLEFRNYTQKELEEVRKEISERPRWMPDDSFDFLNAGNIAKLIEAKEASDLINFFERHKLKKEAAQGFLITLEQMHQMGEPVLELLDCIVKKCKLKKDEDKVEGCLLLTDFLNNCRLRVLNGWTLKEVAKQDLGIDMDELESEQEEEEEDPRLELYREWREKCMLFVSKNVAPLNTVETLRAAAERIGFLEEGSSHALFDPDTQDIVVGEYAAMVDDQFGPPPIKRIIKDKDKYSGDDAKVIALYKQYRYTWLEVLSVTPGVGMKCRDLMTGKKGFLMEISTSRSAVNLVGSTICAGIGTLPNGTWLVLGVIHPANFDSPSTVLRLVLSHLNLPTKLPIQLSFADQARFVAETIRRLNATNKFANVSYGSLEEFRKNNDD